MGRCPDCARWHGWDRLLFALQIEDGPLFVICRAMFGGEESCLPKLGG
jgi:hypothetical protein